MESVNTDYKNDDKITKASRGIELLGYCETVIKQEFGDFMNQTTINIRYIGNTHDAIFDFTVFYDLYIEMVEFHCNINSCNIYDNNFVEIGKAVNCIQRAICLLESVVKYFQENNNCDGCLKCTDNTNRVYIFYVHIHTKLAICMQMMEKTDEAMEHHQNALNYANNILDERKTEIICFCYSSKANFLWELGNETDFEKIYDLRKQAFVMMVVKYGYGSIEVVSYVYNFVSILLKLKKYKEAEKYSNSCYKSLKAADIDITIISKIGLCLVGSSIELFKVKQIADMYSFTVTDDITTNNSIDYIKDVLTEALDATNRLHSDDCNSECDNCDVMNTIKGYFDDINSINET
jgi:tetratricopeptide (TPR) repeat protein